MGFLSRMFGSGDSQAGAADAGVSASLAVVCATCGQDVGDQWHYDFEHIVMAETVGAQCPACGNAVCKEHFAWGADGNAPACPGCGTKMMLLEKGPACTSMVEGAMRDGRYRGPVREPSALGRTVVEG